MKNILNEKPSADLSGRLLFTTKFVANNDIQNMEVLNIGCGFGWFELYALKNKVKKITGIEITEEDLKVARENILDKRAFFKIGSAIALPFADGSFDTVVSWEVIEHIPKHTELQMFNEVKRVLRKGGAFYLSTPYRSFFSCIADPAWWLIGHRHYSMKFLVDLAEKNGFAVEIFEVRGKHFVLVNVLNMYFSKWILRREKLFANYFNKKDTSEYFQKGYSTIFMKMKKK
jgi:SAM-dependent methyltransferase